jgi:hypothetical protein
VTYPNVIGNDVDQYESIMLSTWGLQRKPWTVGELRVLFEGLADDLPVVVSHQPRYQHVGIYEPMIRTSKLAEQSVDLDRCRMYCNGNFRDVLIIE